MTDVVYSGLKVLIIATSHGTLGSGGEATGLWLEELAVPYMVLREAGVEVEIASVRGGKLPIDPRSEKPHDEHPPRVQRFLDDAAATRAMNASHSMSDVDLQQFDAVFFPGGHGTMWDLPDESVGRLVADFLTAGKPVAAVCHGPAALVSARKADGKPLVAGRRITAFSDSEERAVGLMDVVPFALESRLRELGATLRTAPDFEPHAMRDGLLITGQNPASSEKVAQLLLEALAETQRPQAQPVTGGAR